MISVLVGMIASGKSSWCCERAREGSVILNDDSIVNAVHGGDYTLYRKEWKPLYKSIEDHILHTAIAMGKDVVIDRGVDVSVKSRARWIAIGRSLDIPVRAVVFELFPPEVHATRRTKSDGRGRSPEYWLNVAKEHHLRYQAPSIDEGFVEILEKKWIP